MSSQMRRLLGSALGDETGTDVIARHTSQDPLSLFALRLLSDAHLVEVNRSSDFFLALVALGHGHVLPEHPDDQVQLLEVLFLVQAELLWLLSQFVIKAVTLHC